MNREYKKFLFKYKFNRILIFSSQILLVIIFILGWELLAKYNIINTFIYSSPSRILKMIIKLYNDNNLFNHIFVTVNETIISFLLASFIGIIIAIILYCCRFLYNVLEPFITLLNSLPKVALGPVIIIIFGTNIKSIIIMALLISLIITIMNVYNGFSNVDNNKIRYMKSINANKYQIIRYLIIPDNYSVIINTLKINIAMSMIGVVMGEFLVSKEGIGYLINYGSDVFNYDLVYTGIFLLMIVSFILYEFLVLIFKKKSG